MKVFDKFEIILFDFVLVDYEMLEMNGIEVIWVICFNFVMEIVFVIMIIFIIDKDIKLVVIEVGVIEFFVKLFDEMELRIRV